VYWVSAKARWHRQTIDNGGNWKVDQVLCIVIMESSWPQSLSASTLGSFPTLRDFVIAVMNDAAM
jgi:hypothetical protein